MAKSFPDSVVRQAWERSQGKCECRMTNCGQSIPHGKALKWEDRGNDYSQYGWEAHHRNSNGEPVVSNCAILCIPCHKKTSTYGG